MTAPSFRSTYTVGSAIETILLAEESRQKQDQQSLNASPLSSCGIFGLQNKKENIPVPTAAPHKPK